MKVRIKKLSDNAMIPTYADPGASGFDFYATESVIIHPCASASIGTGISVEIPAGYEIQVRGRSGLAFKHDVIAHFGTIDESYRGEIRVKLWNQGEVPIHVQAGDRIAQGVLMPVEKAQFVLLTELTNTERGEGGFGHSGR